MSSTDSSLKPKSEVTRVKYDQLHQLILFFRYLALGALWATCFIFLFRVAFLWNPKDYGGLSLFYVVLCSNILFLSAIFSHHILEWDHLITSLCYPNGRWRCHCNRCLGRRRHGCISRLTPRGLHGILANRHTWTFLPTVVSFFLMLLLTEAGWLFLAVLVILFLAGEIVFYRISRSAVAACRISLNEPLYRPTTFTSFSTEKSVAFYEQAGLPFRAIITGISEEDENNEYGEVLFSMKRSVTLDGSRQRIDGWLKTTFRPDQMQQTQHVPFTPAFDRVPQVTLEPESEIEIIVEPPVVMPHGMRFDIKRHTCDPEADNSVVVHFVVEQINC
jgi:hypothetical protein